MATKRQRDLTGAQFRAWRLSRGLTLKAAGAMLGVQTGAIQHYEKEGVHRTIALAIAAIERGLQPWRPTAEDMAALEERDG